MKTVTMEYNYECNDFMFTPPGVYDHAGILYLCRGGLDKLVILPPDVEKITLVGLKRPATDTLRIKDFSRYNHQTLTVDGEAHFLYGGMYYFLRKWIEAGYDNIRVEY